MNEECGFVREHSFRRRVGTKGLKGQGLYVPSIEEVGAPFEWGDDGGTPCLRKEEAAHVLKTYRDVEVVVELSCR